MSAGQESGAESIPDEERARAHAYALLGRLFYAAPDEGMLAEMCAQAAGTASAAGGDDVSRAWNRLIETACVARIMELQGEHDALFGGVGKALVTPYTSHYVKDTAPDKHLVALREALAEHQLTRRDKVFEVEDHVAAVCDAMRVLIERNQPLPVQRAFFSQFVLPGAMPLCGAIDLIECAVFYRGVAELARAFLELESAAFDMIDT